MDENARKRKRELEGEEPESSDLDMDIEKEKPLEGLKTPVSKAKKQKTEKEPAVAPSVEKQTPATDSEIREAKAKARAEKRRQKAEKKKEKLAQKKEEQKSKKASQKEFTEALGEDKPEQEEDEDEEADETMFDENEGDDIQPLDVAGLADEPAATETPSSAQSNASSASVVSATSSTSSIVPPTGGESSTQKPKEKESKPFKYDPAKKDEYQARLAAKLEALRAARKADGPDGRPAKNRAELIEARRKKEAERKAARKANRQLAKEDEERLKAEEQLARIRGGSGSPSLFPMRSTPENEPNLAFGRVAWNDGQQLKENASGFLESRKKKGKSDPKTALEAAEKKRQRLSGLDEAKRKDIEEKDAWLAAKKRAQGEKVFDDPTLLKKTVKRQEKQKAKSKQEWKERLTNVQKGKVMKQKKREANLQKRKEEKGVKGKKKGAKKPGKKSVKRPGFEGTFKAR
jgi:hypothetical protein